MATVKRAVTQIMAVEFKTELIADTPRREQETKNLRALSSLYRMQAIGSFCRALPDFPLSSYQEAIAMHDFIVAIVESMQGELDDDDYEALRDMRVGMAQYLTTVALDLPVLRTYYTRQETCAILVAHELYGDSRREAEIVARNDIPNPACIPPSFALEVASV